MSVRIVWRCSAAQFASIVLLRSTKSDYRQEDLLRKASPISRCAKRASSTRVLRQKKLVIDERGIAIGGTAHFSPTAPRIEFAGSRVGVKGIEANGVSGPGFGCLGGFEQAPAANALPLLCR